MKLRSCLARASLALAVPALVAGCGGGNSSEAGGLTAFNIVPTSMTLTGPDKNTCGIGYAGRAFVQGGAGPYQVRNTGEGYVQVSKTQLDRPGDYFDVNLLTCMTNVQVLVVDQLGRQANLSLSSTKGN